MNLRSIPKPLEGEFAPYAIIYIGLLPDDGLVLSHMQENLKVITDLIRPLSEAQLTQPFAEGEWTIKEILVHIVDDERIYGYRALRAARNDSTELPGFDQDHFTAHQAQISATLKVSLRNMHRCVLRQSPSLTTSPTKPLPAPVSPMVTV